MCKKLGIMMFICVVTLGAVTAVLAAEQKGAENILPPLAAMAIPFGAGIGIGIAAFGGALGQARGIAAALEGIARNPGASGKIITPMIIGLAMIESLVIYSLLVSLLLVFKI